VHTTDRELIVRAAGSLMLSIVPSRSDAASADSRAA
jgi:hypothetical protein